jgi:hypothetical protein
MVVAAMTQRSRRPAPSSEKKNGKEMATPVPKVGLLPAFVFKTRAMACTNFTTSTATKHTSAFSCVPGWKTEVPPNHYRFGNKSAHASHSHSCIS